MSAGRGAVFTTRSQATRSSGPRAAANGSNVVSVPDASTHSCPPRSVDGTVRYRTALMRSPSTSIPETSAPVHTRFAGDASRMRSARRCEMTPAPLGG